MPQPGTPGSGTAVQPTDASIAQQQLGNSNQSSQVGPNGYVPGQQPGPPAKYGGAPDPWAGVDLPPLYKNELQDLVNRWQAIEGFRVKITPQMLVAMGKQNILNMFELGKYMWTQMTAEQKTNTPWAEFGLSADEFHLGVMHFSRDFKDLTGQDISQEILHEAFAQGYDPTRAGVFDYKVFLQNNAKMREAYPWLKYNMNWTTFQEHKSMMRLNFGFDLTDKEAAQQLQYFHAAAPDFTAAQAAAPQVQGGQSAEAVGGASVAR